MHAFGLASCKRRIRPNRGSLSIQLCKLLFEVALQVCKLQGSHIYLLLLCDILYIFFVVKFACLSAEAYDPLDPNGNITIKWDITQWTPDGYVVSSLDCQLST